MIRQIIFKLKHDIANDSELPLAAMELSAVFGSPLAPVKNLADVLFHVDWLRESLTAASPSRIQDVFLRMPYPGAIQAHRSESIPVSFSVDRLAALTYCRDVFILFSGSPHLELPKLSVPGGNAVRPTCEALTPAGQRLSPMISLHQLEPQKDRYLLRVIMAHCFLECTDHVVRLAQKLKDVDRMYEGMLTHLQSNLDRPFAASVQMGYKWIEDFIDDRRPPNAYASHSLFGLRGRFFPRMIRALTNHLLTETGAKAILDPFGGVGTLGIEASLLGVGSKSYDLNPFFVHISRAKHHALRLSKKEVGQIEEVREYAQTIRLQHAESNGTARSLFDEAVTPLRFKLPDKLSRNVKDTSVELVAELGGKIAKSCSDDATLVAQLALAYYAKSFMKKYPREKILKSFWAHLSRILYLDRFMKRLYEDGIQQPPADADFEVGNIKALSKRESAVQAIITSPPYTTAIDYVGNDVMGYYVTGQKDHQAIEAEMIGSTKLGRVANDDVKSWAEAVPTKVKMSHRRLLAANRKKAVCIAKYFHDMTAAFEQIAQVLATGGKMAMIVCDSQEFGSGKSRIQYGIANAIIQIGEASGLSLDRKLEVDLTKNGDGNIRQESVLLFSK